MQRCHKTLLAGVCVALMLMAHSAAADTETKLDDATLFAIFDQANTTDIWIARLGLKQGQSEEVRGLAKMVAAEHESVQQMGRDIAHKLGIIPVPPDNDASAANLAKTIALLQSKSGSDFDKAYLQHEIVFHQSVIDAIKGTMLPSIKSGEFKALVNKVLPGFEHHLAATKAAARKLGVSD